MKQMAGKGSHESIRPVPPYAISIAPLYMCFQNATGEQINSLRERKMAATTSLLARAASAISEKSSLPIRAAAAATVAVGTLLGAHSVSGQQLFDNVPPSALGATAKQPAALAVARLPADQCRNAIIIGNAIMRREPISPRLAASFDRFGESQCRLDTVFERDTDVDERAFGEFRVRLIALRMSDANPPRVLAK